MQKDRQFAVSGRWALASDGEQWVIQKRLTGDRWGSVKFIRSDRAWLEHRLRKTLEVPQNDADRLLEGLPATFDEWKALHWHDVSGRQRGTELPAGAENRHDSPELAINEPTDTMKAA
jgi:hypothetical protein